ncbi:MAG: hypothetical protein AAGD34_11425 [Pseudomonadota bacterium]
MATFAGRLGTALKSLILALLNASIILIILAALAVGFAVNAVHDFAQSSARDIGRSAIEGAGLDPSAIEARMAAIADDVAALRQSVEQRAADRGEGSTRRLAQALAPQLDRLSERLAAVRTAIEGLSHPTVSLDPETLEGLEAIVSNALNALADIADDDGPAQGTAQ